MKDNLELKWLLHDLAETGMRVEEMLKSENELRLKDNSTVVMLELVSLDIQHSYERVQDEIKALSLHGVHQ